MYIYICAQNRRCAYKSDKRCGQESPGMTHVNFLNLPREQIEMILVKTCSRKLSLIEQVCRFFAPRHIVTPVEFTITERAIRAKMNKEHVGAELHRPSYLQLLCKREIAHECGKKMNTCSTNSRYFNDLMISEINGQLELPRFVQRDELILKATTVSSSIRVCCHESPTKQMAILHTIAKQDVKALVASGGIETCRFVLKQQARDDAWSKAFRIWNLCVFNMEYLERILKLDGIEIAGSVLKTFKSDLHSWPDFIAASVILTMAASRLNDKTCKILPGRALIDRCNEHSPVVICAIFYLKHLLENDWENRIVKNRTEKLGLLNNCLFFLFNLFKNANSKGDIALFENYMLQCPSRDAEHHKENLTLEMLCIDILQKEDTFQTYEFVLNPVCKILTIWLQNGNKKISALELKRKLCEKLVLPTSTLQCFVDPRIGDTEKVLEYRDMLKGSLHDLCLEMAQHKRSATCATSIVRAKKRIKF